MSGPFDNLNSWHSLRLRRARSEDDLIVGAYGGHPRGIRTHEWPKCQVCGQPMCFMAQFDAGPWINLNGYARASMFICHATGGRCEDWDPWKGANHVLLQKELDNNMYDGPPTVRVYRRMRLALDLPALDEWALMQRVEQEGLPMSTALQQIKHDKIGGGAVWLHGDDTPQSRTGKGPMRLAVQLTTDLVRFDITTGGMAYLFLDDYDKSPNGAAMLWQNGT